MATVSRPEGLAVSSDAVEPYLQIAAHIRALIALGAVRPGEQLPSSRTMANDLGVARGTVDRAYDLLRGYGIVARRIGLGFYVPKDAKAIASGRISAIQAEFETFLSRLRAQEYEEDEIRQVARQVFFPKGTNHS